MPDLPIQTLESRVAYANLPWHGLREDRIPLPGGHAVSCWASLWVA